MVSVESRGGFAGTATVSADWTGRANAGPLDNIADPALDRHRSGRRDHHERRRRTAFLEFRLSIQPEHAMLAFCYAGR
jgi:hypothetical protein